MSSEGKSGRKRKRAAKKGFQDKEPEDEVYGYSC